MKEKTNTLIELQLLVEDAFGVSLKEKKRNREYVDARIAFGYLARKKLKYTYKKIGEFLNKDHSNIIHYNKVFEGVFKSDNIFRDNFLKINIEDIIENDFYKISKKIEYHKKRIELLNEKLNKIK
jgi:chromosomal replication initiation ATPase DnaA